MLRPDGESDGAGVRERQPAGALPAAASGRGFRAATGSVPRSEQPPPLRPPPPPPPPPPPRPRRRGRRPRGARGTPAVRWGIGDVFAVFAIGLLVSVSSLPPSSSTPTIPNQPNTLVVLICAQNFAIIGRAGARRRSQGHRVAATPLRPQIRRPGTAWLADLPWFFAGIGLQLVALLPIGLLEPSTATPPAGRS